MEGFSHWGLRYIRGEKEKKQADPRGKKKKREPATGQGCGRRR